MAGSLREIRKALVRDQIVKAATEMFLEQDIRQVTMRKVAERVNYSPMALYAYFPNKPALLRGVTESLFERLDVTLVKAMERGCQPRERLIEVTKAYLEFGASHPKQYQFLFNTSWWADALEQDKDCPLNIGEAAFMRLHEAIAENIVPAQRKPETVMQTSLMWWAAVHGLTSLLISMPAASFLGTDVPDALVDTILSGCTTRKVFPPASRAAKNERLGVTKHLMDGNHGILQTVLCDCFAPGGKVPVAEARGSDSHTRSVKSPAHRKH